jgi:3-hydroxyacyl-CoA dehydrogenase
MPVSITREGDIALVTIDYPPVNALNKALRQELLDAANELDADSSIRGVVLTCAGRTAD